LWSRLADRSRSARVLSHLLGEVLEEAYDTTGLALTALVTHKYGDH
jgi:hypothetical protein